MNTGITTKSLIVSLIASKDANSFVRKHHYSGKVVPNSSIHFGIFHKKTLLGVMSFGPPMRKDLSMRLVRDTKWDGMIELNRMALCDLLPRNSESRCLAVAIRILKKRYPNLEWIQTFADSCQCGDGTIYRAVGFLLTGVKKNSELVIGRDGSVISTMSLFHNKESDISSFKKLDGYMIRYVYPINETVVDRLTVPVLPYRYIDEVGAGMYKGEKRGKKAKSGDQPDSGGAVPTSTLQLLLEE